MARAMSMPGGTRFPTVAGGLSDFSAQVETTGHNRGRRRGADLALPPEMCEGSLMVSTKQSKLAAWLLGARAFVEHHPRLSIAIPLAAGFLFDVLTLKRIDNRWMMLQQAGYLLALAVLLVLDARPAPGPGARHGGLARLWPYREELMHFFLGGLLSKFSLFYVKSASGLVAPVFLAAMFALLVANDLPRFRRLGNAVRVGLFSLCLTAYLSYVLPTLLGALRGWMFYAAAATCWSFGAVLFLVTWTMRDARGAGRIFVWPFTAVQALLVALYLARAIPPVPLSIQAMGIYHGVERQAGQYLLTQERSPMTSWWGNGDRIFHARPGDKIYVFARIFAPHFFRDRVNIRWLFKDPRAGWRDYSAYRMEVTGGRDQGFRGYATKENYQPGWWRVQIETEDGREIGRLSFTIVEDLGTDPRDLVVDRG